MIKISKIILFTFLILLFVGVASAADDMSNTTATAEEVNTVLSEKTTVSHDDTAKELKAENIQNDEINRYSKDKNISKKNNGTVKQEGNDREILTSAISWRDLIDVMDKLKNTKKNTTIIFAVSNFKCYQTIKWNNPNMLLTLNATGRTIDGDQKQLFNFAEGTKVIINKLTIKNAKSKDEGGAIKNMGTLTLNDCTLNNNNAVRGGAIHNRDGTVTLNRCTLNDNNANRGGAIYNRDGTLTLNNCTLNNNKANIGGAICNLDKLTINNSSLNNNKASTDGGAVFSSAEGIYSNVNTSNFTSNSAKNGGAIFSVGYLNVKGNNFNDNHATKKETIDLYDHINGKMNNNTYNSTDINLTKINLSIPYNQYIFYPWEEVVLNIDVQPAKYIYYKDFKAGINDITLYINGEKNVTTKYENITLSNLEAGDYTLYFTTCNQQSNNVTFKVIDTTAINLTTKDIEMVQGRTVTFSAQIDYKNTTINQGKVYFEIDGKPLTDENGSILYAPVEDNWAFLSYKMPSNISVGNHTLTAVYTYDNRIIAKDTKTLTLIESIPGGAGEKEEIPSEDIKQETYKKDTTHQKTSTKHAKTIYSAIATSHKVITCNNMITLGKTITLGKLNEIFGQTFTNGQLLLYIDGELVFNGTVNDDLSTVILEIMEKYMGKHEMKAEFTDNNNESKTYTENVTIN